jgi:adenylate cyclase
MRIRIRLAISGLVLASIIVSAVGVHVLWWRTAETNSQTLVATINEQIVAAVGKELETITTQARAAHTAIRTLFVQNVLGTRPTSANSSFSHSSSRSRASPGWHSAGRTATSSPRTSSAIWAWR